MDGSQFWVSILSAYFIIVVLTFCFIIISNSIHSGLSSEDEASSLDDSESSDNAQEEEGEDDAMELDRPLTADETRRLAESWKKRYSTDPGVKTVPEDADIKEQEENGGLISIDVPAFPVPSVRQTTLREVSRQTAAGRGDATESSEDTEMGSDEELQLDDDDDEQLSEYENVDEEEEDQEDEGSDEEDETSDEQENSATEIETDSEFDASEAPQAQGPGILPTIVVNESETENLKKSLEQLTNGDDDGDQEIQMRTSSAIPKAEYVDQYVTLEDARPTLQRTMSNENPSTGVMPASSSSHGQSATGRTGVLAYLRRSELLDKSPSQPDVSSSTTAAASANALELKKKYLFDYPLGPIGSSLTAQSRSASATNLDNKLKSFVDTISEAQKKLNPAPQPSVPMQV